jgi:hypothetical protein
METIYEIIIAFSAFGVLYMNFIPKSYYENENENEDNKT